MDEYVLEEGWHLMSVTDLERELARWRGQSDRSPSRAEKLTIDQGLAYRNAGNLPDHLGRTARLVLRIDNVEDLRQVERKRLLYEPDFHDSPTWRREGSKPVNVVPLRAPGVSTDRTESWLDDPQLASLEDEWRRSGTVAGLRVPGPYRSFVYKTVLALKAAGRPVDAQSVVASVERWLPENDALRLRESLLPPRSAE